jgi:hypothetical protein
MLDWDVVAPTILASFDSIGHPLNDVKSKLEVNFNTLML